MRSMQPPKARTIASVEAGDEIAAVREAISLSGDSSLARETVIAESRDGTPPMELNLAELARDPEFMQALDQKIADAREVGDEEALATSEENRTFLRSL